MTIYMYIIIAVLVVITIILSTIHSLLDDIQDDLKLIRRRVFKPKDECTVESYDISSLHPTAISTTEEFGGEYTNKFNELYENGIITKNKVLEKRVDDCVQDIYELKNEIDALKQILHDHEQKLNDIYIEE